MLACETTFCTDDRSTVYFAAQTGTNSLSFIGGLTRGLDSFLTSGQLGSGSPFGLTFPHVIYLLIPQSEIWP